MKTPLPPLRHVPPAWVRTSTGGSGAFADPEPQSEPVAAPAATPVMPALTNHFEPVDAAFEPLLPPPPPPELFATLRSEDGRVTLTNEALMLNEERFAWRALEGVDVQPVRWLLGWLLGAFILCGFLLAYLQFWLRTTPAALGIGLGIALLAWGLRGTNRWRVHQPGQHTRYFSLTGAARSWQTLAQEANRRINQRHHEAATAAAYWLQQAALMAPAPLPTATTGPDEQLSA